MRAGCEKVDVTIRGRDREKGGQGEGPGAGERKREIVYYILGGSQSSDNVKPPRLVYMREKRRNSI